MSKVLTFTKKVHNLIVKIPEGRLVTYKDIANKLHTRAYRAVGGACNKSPGMPECPCHRVLSSDYRLHGFASGIENKKKLLEKEGIKLKKVVHNGKIDYEVMDYDKHKFKL